MAHEVETLAYAGLRPWHGLGVKVEGELSPVEMAVAAGVDWGVTKVQAYIKDVARDDLRTIPAAALVRDTDGKILDVVSDDWQTVQNLEAARFFDPMFDSGKLTMETAGSLRGGQNVFFLGKLKGETVEAVKGDRIDAYLLLTNFHKYGFCTDVRFTPIRVVCANTLAMALHGDSRNHVKVPHSVAFDAEQVRETLGLAHEQLIGYSETAKFLASRRAYDESAAWLFKRVFPTTPGSDKAANDNLSRNATRAMEILHTQPGARFAEGSWWQAYNAVTFLADHELGRTADGRLASAWYGPNQVRKLKALQLATEFANNSPALAA